ncbi:MAG: hypothetical protein WCT46_00525 [Candidatus Gracilibacteria bacterium]|jgi:hypothetical protein
MEQSQIDFFQEKLDALAPDVELPEFKDGEVLYKTEHFVLQSGFRWNGGGQNGKIKEYMS